MSGWAAWPHTPGIEVFEHRITALGPDRNLETVLAFRIDPLCHVLPAVGKDFHNATVNEYPKLQRFAFLQFERRDFRWTGM
ncbi:MAG: hypothetical protein A2V98_12015 [Planctomycetes bacterium RBG_16_64_12]|nr:MAG: hypothetical protein A2V98_12015 [Planctomycetes bacterium RBG_16_64_12]